MNPKMLLRGIGIVVIVAGFLLGAKKKEEAERIAAGFTRTAEEYQAKARADRPFPDLQQFDKDAERDSRAEAAKYRANASNALLVWGLGGLVCGLALVGASLKREGKAS